MISIIIVLILIVAFLSYKLYEFYCERQVFEAVKWCVYYDSFHWTYPEARMRDHILHLQHELSLEEKYRIAQDEVNAINEILLAFRHDVIQKYFSGSFQKLGFSFERDLIYYLEKNEDKNEYRANISYHKVYYILQLHNLKLHNITDDNKLGVIIAKATKETIDNLLLLEDK